MYKTLQKSFLSGKPGYLVIEFERSEKNDKNKVCNLFNFYDVLQIVRDKNDKIKIIVRFEPFDDPNVDYFISMYKILQKSHDVKWSAQKTNEWHTATLEAQFHECLTFNLPRDEESVYITVDAFDRENAEKITHNGVTFSCQRSDEPPESTLCEIMCANGRHYVVNHSKERLWVDGRRVEKGERRYLRVENMIRFSRKYAYVRFKYTLK